MLDKAYTRSLLTKLTVPSRQLHTSLDPLTVTCKTSWYKAVYIFAQRNVQYAMILALWDEQGKSSWDAVIRHALVHDTSRILAAHAHHSGFFFFSLASYVLQVQNQGAGSSA